MSEFTEIDPLAAAFKLLSSNESRLATLQARGDRLAVYACHDDTCDAVQTPWSDPGPCTCGYTEALAEWRKEC